MDGNDWDISKQNKLDNCSQLYMAAGVDNQVSTDNLNMALDRNYNHNNLSILQCGNDIVQGNFSNKHRNVISNADHQFGFCPVSPLQLYKGKPVHWKNIPDDLQAHKLITATGNPIFLAARIPVHSQLNIDKWCLYLAQYWDAQLIDLLEYGFPMDACRDNQFISTEVNHTSALQNVHQLIRQYRRMYI